MSRIFERTLCLLPRRVWPLPDGQCKPKPTAAAGRGGAAGFTLVELLVVVGALATLSVTVGLSVAARDAGTLPDAARLRALDAELRDSALIGRATRGFRVLQDGVQPLIRAGSGWRAVGDPVMWRDAADWTGAVGPDGPRRVVMYLSDGRSTPFALAFGDRTETCVSDGWRAVACAGR